tara:strand:+ start:19 stop:1080 length:1062 start_codon:yes stop_codon:yes gene_type:complete
MASKFKYKGLPLFITGTGTLTSDHGEDYRSIIYFYTGTSIPTDIVNRTGLKICIDSRNNNNGKTYMSDWSIFFIPKLDDSNTKALKGFHIVYKTWGSFTYYDIYSSNDHHPSTRLSSPESDYYEVSALARTSVGGRYIGEFRYMCVRKIKSGDIPDDIKCITYTTGIIDTLGNNDTVYNRNVNDSIVLLTPLVEFNNRHKDIIRTNRIEEIDQPVLIGNTIKIHHNTKISRRDKKSSVTMNTGDRLMFLEMTDYYSNSKFTYNNMPIHNNNRSIDSNIFLYNSQLGQLPIWTENLDGITLGTIRYDGNNEAQQLYYDDDYSYGWIYGNITDGRNGENGEASYEEDADLVTVFI